ncbi:hypothetical protein SteCoe_33456 [Stentor coeruleus]|uniref:Uncharacterized protein n=1 Tax=Stentor coeruleus TaxID=5963 RepID=A0A1R2AWR5_9CILI|nr:hypothetical protein SteCoe_33456 [Stentor coeruleus]
MDLRGINKTNNPTGLSDNISTSVKIVIKGQDKKLVEFSNQSRKNQFFLGSYKGVPKSVSSSHFKEHEIPKESLNTQNNSEVTKNHFSLGNYSNDYTTTASDSFVTHEKNSNHSIKTAPSSHISLGDDKVKMTSTGHSEFMAKKVTKLSKTDMEKIKENHHKAHFHIGTYESTYSTTNKEYRASSVSNPKKFIPDSTPHVVFGNYKPTMTTEKQENYVKPEYSMQLDEKNIEEMRKSHVFMGKEKPVRVSTSVDSFQGKQLCYKSKSQKKDYPTNISLGSSIQKWQSSYSLNYFNRNYTPYSKYQPNENSNILFGTWDNSVSNQDLSVNSKKTQISCRKTTGKVNFQSHGPLTPQNRTSKYGKNNNLSFGDFKNKFETSYKRYGENSGKPSKIDKETLKNITSCHFVYGNYVNDGKSKFQDDFKAPGSLPEKYDLSCNENRKNHMNFGEKQEKWESTYMKTFKK